MSIKGKLIGLVLLMSLVFAMLAGYLLWASWKIRHQVGYFVPAISYLRGIADVRANLTRQVKEATDYLVMGEAGDRAGFAHFGRLTRQSFELWEGSARQQKALGVEGEGEDLAKAETIRASYDLWEEQIHHLFSLVDAGHQSEAQRLFADQSDRLIEGAVLARIDESLEDGLNEVQDAYLDLLMSAGMIPWIASDALHQIRGTQASIDYLLAVNRLSAGVNKQLKALLDYLFFGADHDRQFFADYGKDTKSAIEACARAANRKAALDPASRSDLLNEVVTIERSYGQVLALAEKAIHLKQNNQTGAALALIVEQLDPLLDGGLMPKLALALDDGGQEIFNLTRAASRQGVIVVILVSLLLAVGTAKLIQQILRSLRQLRAGITIIGAGNLDYRINLATPDEFGNLAAQFDTMVDRLQQSRADVERLNRELEQRVIDRTLQLETANRELQSFSYSVSHDLRTPLARISALCQVLLADETLPEPPEIMATLQRIGQSTQEMEQLIQALLSLSQVTSGELNRTAVDLSALVETLAAELRQRQPQRSAEFRIAPGVVVNGDRSLLLVVLANLLGNAWKYSARTGTTLIEFGVVQRAGQRTCFVRDNGVGFDMARAEKLFTPFQRLHETGEFDGTGIGLATVQRIIHRHGGQVWAESAPGQGATFYFFLGNNGAAGTATPSIPAISDPSAQIP
ncbi:ATP-binding protein [Desulfuromonas carbonis]|uniref:sensor histidine kinase n=1 Tax=Desulfuromonas sp. DDH964 TaxID=1823759 RepID=UPI00078BDF54|nr:ATP-binding protein [Desulfuromonas sp. DDH964]AMV73065.1 sensor histidine kinase, HAMP domain-containing [Desulfuromonas sp. DDH964]